jgi:hypothetical protein
VCLAPAVFGVWHSSWNSAHVMESKTLSSSLAVRYCCHCNAFCTSTYQVVAPISHAIDACCTLHIVPAASDTACGCTGDYSHSRIASYTAGLCLQVQATTVTKAELRQQLLSALTTKPGSAARAAGLTVLADTLGLTAEDRASLGLTGAHSSSSSTAAAGVGSTYGSSAAAGGESAGFGLLGEGQSPAAAAAGGAAAGAYGQGGGVTTTRADGGRAAAAGGRRSVLGRVVGVLFGRGAGDKSAGELAFSGAVCWDCLFAWLCRHVDVMYDAD